MVSGVQSASLYDVLVITVFRVPAGLRQLVSIIPIMALLLQPISSLSCFSKAVKPEQTVPQELLPDLKCCLKDVFGCGFRQGSISLLKRGCVQDGDTSNGTWNVNLIILSEFPLTENATWTICEDTEVIWYGVCLHATKHELRGTSWDFGHDVLLDRGFWFFSWPGPPSWPLISCGPPSEVNWWRLG